ncbi:MAG: PD40 domain-containing protein [Cyanobacteria bacterium SID2]|nr:PD40 domain-containing protein [Cyanobacteria bacterium SID2]
MSEFSASSVTRIAPYGNSYSSNTGDLSFEADISISEDGRYIAFVSQSNDLVENDTNPNEDVFVFDRDTGSIELISAIPEDLQQQLGEIGFPFNRLANANLLPSMSADGRFVAFVGFFYFGGGQIFLRDRQTGETFPVSVNADGDFGNTNFGFEYSSGNPAMSADGRYVSFISAASNLVENDRSGWDGFIFDRETGTLELANVDKNGEQILGTTVSISLSEDGRYVSFISSIPSEVSEEPENVLTFLRDRETGEVSQITEPAWSVAETNPWSFSQSATADGRYEVFASHNDTLVAGDTNRSSDIFVREVKTGSIARLITPSSGQQIHGDSVNPRISEDGRSLVFVSTSNNLVEGDLSDSADIFLADVNFDEIDFEASPPGKTVTGTEAEDEILGTPNADRLYGDLGDDTLSGEADNDLIEGGEGEDILVGGGGEDLLLGDLGADRLYGNEENDILEGGDGSDELCGGRDDDILEGGLGDDELEGDLGNDWLNGGYGSDDLSGGDGNDWLNGGDDFDYPLGDGGNDWLNGGDDFDYPLGDDGNDWFNGGWSVKAEYDMLDGGAGDDTLVSSDSGKLDSLTGGTGSDVFLIQRESSSTANYDPSNPDYAIVTDFEPGIDRVILGEKPDDDFAYELEEVARVDESGKIATTTYLYTHDFDESSLSLIAVFEGVSISDLGETPFSFS